MGHTNKRIAAVLEISGWTVSAHLRRVFDKLGVSSRAAMVRVLTEDSSLTWSGPPHEELRTDEPTLATTAQEFRPTSSARH